MFAILASGLDGSVIEGLMPNSLPIDDALPDIGQSLQAETRLVLAAPPGAGKTTRVPLFLKGQIGGKVLVEGKILLLEPRRVAARMAAKQMARSLGEPLGETVGLSTRVDRKVSAKTQIEVITDGLFTRRILNDPELTGVGAVIFDEFHERRLNADLGLALCLEAQAALREDLRLILMSATLDTGTVAAAISAPVVVSEGWSYPVETEYLGRSDQRIEERMTAAIRRALVREDGSILAFLPGAGEINRTAERLVDIPSDVEIAPLYGALSPAAQDKAVSPCEAGKRKIVLATDIAESALTIDGVRIVIDSGLARVAEMLPGGLGSRLRTVTASRASVDQRRGRAGRTQEGVCYRLWDEAATRGLPMAPEPEILVNELSGLVLALAEWGERDPFALTWITSPPTGKIRAAQSQLKRLGALDEDGGITPLGAEMSKLPLPPRLAALIVRAETPEEKALAAEIAALVGERGMGGNSTDLRERLSRFRSDSSVRAKTLRQQAARWGGGAKAGGDMARLLANAFPDQIARRRNDDGGSYLMASGTAVKLEPTDALAKSDWLVVVDLGGAAKEVRVSLAIPIAQQDALEIGGVQTRDDGWFDPATGKFSARRVKALGAIILSEIPLPKPDADTAASAMLAAVAELGFRAIGAGDVVVETCARLALLSQSALIEVSVPDEAVLQGTAKDWLLPFLKRGGARVPKPDKVREALIQSFDWPVQEALRKHMPLKLELPSGQTARVDYLDARAPLVSARAQAFWGVSEHLMLGNGRVPVTVEMLSPGMKPVATTQNLPAFWTGGYKDMARDMRGRYPKHDWPDNPAESRAHGGLTKKRLQ